MTIYGVGFMFLTQLMISNYLETQRWYEFAN